MCSTSSVQDINNLGIDSFLSPYVKEIIAKFSTSDRRIGDPLDTDLCLNWSTVRPIIPLDHDLDSPFTDEKLEELSDITALIASIDDIFATLIDSQHSQQYLSLVLDRNLFWTQGLKPVFFEAIRLLKSDDSRHKTGLSLQLITSCCEQSLGNLVLTQVSFVPPLLRDLLNLKQLEDIISKDLVFLLKLIIGPPITVNVRNILWHGFVGPTDLDRRFATFLLSICVTIGRDLSEQYRTQPLPQRILHNVSNDAKEFQIVFPILTSGDLKTIEQVLEKSPFILKATDSLWKYSLELFDSHRGSHCFGQSIVVLLPQLESALRYIYCSVNSIPHRMMTAIAKEYYLTFTEILSPTLPDSDRENSIHKLFGQTIIELLLDIILIPEGPKIRDKSSHGQIDYSSVEQFVANHVICAYVLVLVMADIKLFNRSEKYRSMPIIEDILRIGSHYRCLYHPLSQLRTKLIALESSLSLLEISSEEVLKTSNNEFKGSEFNGRIELLEPLSQRIKLIIGTNRRQSLSRRLNAMNLDVVSNRRSDCEIGIMRQMAEHIGQTFDNMRQFLLIRGKQLDQKSLRSRQRTNYQSMVNNLHVYIRTLSMLNSFLFLLFIDESEDQHSSDILCKNFKSAISLCENFRSNSDITVNKWDKCLKICHNFNDELNILMNKLN